MKILITGGAGFLGTHLMRRLLKDGHSVTVVDNLISGSRRNFSEHNGHKNFEFIEHDIVEPIKINADQVYHLACPASPKFYSEHPIRTAKTCFMGTVNALGIAKRNQAPILFTSSSEVYGYSTVRPESEDYFGNVNPVETDACYREGKRIAETLMTDYRRRHGVNTRIARLFNTYGPHMRVDDGRAMSKFIVQAFMNEDLTIYGDGQTERSFLYIDDLIEALILMMNNKENEGGPVNVGYPKAYTLKQTAECVLRQVKESRSRIKYIDYPTTGAKFRDPDITRARKLLSWEPKVGLEEGVALTAQYFREHFHGTQ